MSALTKIGVVLLVLSSLLLSAGIVVFVNKVEDFQKLANSKDMELKKAVVQYSDLKALLDAEVQHRLQVAKDLTARIDAIKKEVSDRDATIAGLNGQIVRLEQDKKGLEVALATAMQTQQGLQGQLAQANTHITELRAIRDRLVDERNSINVQLTDALAKVDALEKARRFAEERNEALRAQVNELENRIKSVPALAAETMARPAVSGAPIEGVVSAVFNAGGKPWASISIGSKDNVSKDMKFNVINNSEFLGYLKIQQIEPNEAVGVLEGPKVDKVKAGDLVKTQLQ